MTEHGQDPEWPLSCVCGEDFGHGDDLDDLADLQAELDDLEATDPKVAAAAASYDAMVAKVTARPAPDPPDVAVLAFLAQLAHDMTTHRSNTDAAIASVVASARRIGCTWARIGHALGVSAQSAHAKYADRTSEREPST